MTRTLSGEEIAELSEGLWRALTKAGASPKLRRQPHPAAYVVALWRGGAPVMAVGNTIWWPQAPATFAGSNAMSVLQHELQHVLEYADGSLSIWRYLFNPRNWIYRYDLARVRGWQDLGAEQRAEMVEDLWRLERAGEFKRADRLRALIPWAGRDAD
jgi:hypothetical protein